MSNLNDFDFKAMWDKAEELTEDESRLIAKWKGLAPNAVARAMAAEFLGRYPEPCESSHQLFYEKLTDIQILSGMLTPSDNSWEELDRNLKNVARLYDGDRLTYWDTMRELWKCLPRELGRKERRAFYRSRDYSGEENSQIIKMDVCDLCWRSVPKRNKDIASHSLCRFHDLSSRDSEYRKRYRIKYGLNKDDRFIEVFRMHTSILRKYNYRNGPYSSNYSNMNDIKPENSCHWGDVWCSYPELLIRNLPYVHSYLKNNNIDMSCSMNIIVALDDAPDNEPADAAEYRLRFYEDASTWLHTYIDFLAWAEIWLMLEENHKHGGKRKGAGHPGRENAT